MQYDHFIHYVKQSFEELMGPEVPVHIHSVLKNNNVHLDALTILPKGQIITPTIYLNDYYELYQSGTPLDTIIREIQEVYTVGSNAFQVDTSAILNFSTARNLIAYKLINYHSNQELLQTIPHIPYLDLAIVFYLLLEHDSLGDATALITNEHLSMWRTDIDTIYELARHNSPLLLEPALIPLKDLMVELITEDLKQELLSQENTSTENDAESPLPVSEDTLHTLAQEILFAYTGERDLDSPMYVLTNSSRCNGAAVLLYENVLERAADRIGGSFYILPSSIHEIILLPDDLALEPEQLQTMVKEINLHDVLETERLSDTVYYYDTESRQLKIS